MILTKEITLKVNPKTLSYYKSLGYDMKGCEIITIPVKQIKLHL